MRISDADSKIWRRKSSCWNCGSGPGPVTHARSRPPPSTWPRRCPPPPCSVMWTPCRHGWRRSWSPRTHRQRRRAPSVTRHARPVFPARRSWPPKPRNWPPTPPSGRPPATGSGPFSTSGSPSTVWIARPTTRCGSGIRRHGRPSTADAAPISPSWTVSAPAPARKRKNSASGPRRCRIRRIGVRPLRRSGIC